MNFYPVNTFPANFSVFRNNINNTAPGHDTDKLLLIVYYRYKVLIHGFTDQVFPYQSLWKPAHNLLFSENPG